MSKSRDEDVTSEPRYCGIVRPIADFDPYPNGHWAEVHVEIAEAIESAGYTPRLVSESEASGVIQGDIVTNLYHDGIVVCDVSGRNPNVMFELGMRIAFEKPVVIVKDDRTPFSFDIAPIKHIPYPSTLRISGMKEFKVQLVEKIKGTMQAINDPQYRGYLQQFGNIKATTIGDQTITISEMAEEMRELQRSVSGINSNLTNLIVDVSRQRRTVLESSAVGAAVQNGNVLSRIAGATVEPAEVGLTGHADVFSGSLRRRPLKPS